MIPKLVVTDLDGTLVRDDGSVSARTRDVFAKVSAAGVPVAGATGRGPRLTGMSRGDLPSADYFVLGGGGRVLDLTGETPRVLLDLRLPGRVLEELMPILEAKFGPLQLTVEVEDFESAPLWSESEQWPYPDPIVLRRRADMFAARVIKGFLQVAPELGHRLTEAVHHADVEIIQSWPGFVEIHPPKVDKAYGLTVVTELLGISPAEVLVFGDQLNDVPSFAWAGRRVAVANANPKILDMADEVTLSNNEDGVAVYLEKLFGL
ncbi:HAD family hydrolase [Hamadaea tsunoensis]|uniref:HAD family hydrolase n=1 Tax=Hamadaea tsunoensis TaxID=53368 RepID=UPI0004155D02|nr:HAD hydrolase family protein [Hamadaea tsunoensis]